MRKLLFHIPIILLPGCTQPSQYPPIEKPTSYIQVASIEPGCLLPSPDLIDASAADSITLEIKISTDGTPLSATVTKSSNNIALDKAFQTAAMACHFKPATSFSPYTSTTAPIESNYVLTQNWPAGHIFSGPFRCFRPDYPSRALRHRQQAKVYVYFQRTRPENTFEIRAESSTEYKELIQASLTTVERCLAHEETQKDLLVDTWYVAPMIWLIE